MKRKPDTQKDSDFKKELQEAKNKYLRALADYQNLEKRTKQKIEDEKKLALKDFAVKFFDVLDVLEQAEKQLKDKGLSLGLKKLRDLLRSENIEEIETVGKSFDPTCMECTQLQGDGDKVISEFRKGYKMNGQVIRVSRVKVGKNDN